MNRRLFVTIVFASFLVLTACGQQKDAHVTNSDPEEKVVINKVDPQPTVQEEESRKAYIAEYSGEIIVSTEDGDNQVFDVPTDIESETTIIANEASNAVLQLDDAGFLYIDESSKARVHCDPYSIVIEVLDGRIASVINNEVKDFDYAVRVNDREFCLDQGVFSVENRDNEVVIAAFDGEVAFWLSGEDRIAEHGHEISIVEDAEIKSDQPIDYTMYPETMLMYLSKLSNAEEDWLAMAKEIAREREEAKAKQEQTAQAQNTQPSQQQNTQPQNNNNQPQNNQPQNTPTPQPVPQPVQSQEEAKNIALAEARRVCDQMSAAGYGNSGINVQRIEYSDSNDASVFWETTFTKGEYSISTVNLSSHSYGISSIGLWRLYQNGNAIDEGGSVAGMISSASSH